MRLEDRRYEKDNASGEIAQPDDIVFDLLLSFLSKLLLESTSEKRKGSALRS